MKPFQMSIMTVDGLKTTDILLSDQFHNDSKLINLKTSTALFTEYTILPFMNKASGYLTTYSVLINLF